MFYVVACLCVILYMAMVTESGAQSGMWFGAV